MNGPLHIRKRPLHAEALRFDGANHAEIVIWATDHAYVAESQLYIITDRGDVVAEPGDYIIRGLVGEHYPITPAAFAAGWELVS
jgi:hypothetical protein